uniref:Uncharacterized protein n=1 Tax=uncultured prokaryote TaxID=198431 RepID=A0A0H5Q4C0_9ZZZZ|nr:hypothetical protein [uncultured prokaryote]
MPIREVITDIITTSGGGKVSVMYFDSASGDPADQVEAVDAFWLANCTELSTSVKFTVRTNGRAIDEATGTLVGSWNSGLTPAQRAGLKTQEAVADATQALVQWQTGSITNGRFVRGRTFVPGLPVATLSGGNLAAVQVNKMQGWADQLIDAAVGFSIWRRPSSTGAGNAPVVVTSSVWNELAVLRRRRG